MESPGGTKIKMKESSSSPMETVTLRHKDGIVDIERLPSGKNRITVKLTNNDLFMPQSKWETAYPPHLVKQILDARGPNYLCDEIMRDEDETYIQHNLKYDILGYVSEEYFKNRRILDFGCGYGASTMVIARMFPDAEIVGTDLVELSIFIARLRTEYYGFKKVTFAFSEDRKCVPQGIGLFDGIIFSAVFEHLLPEERICLLPKVWGMLKPGGILFVDQTPNRYFPLEVHTSGLPLINYLPDKAAYYVAKKFSGRRLSGCSWETLLHKGLRGATVDEILGILKKDPYKPALEAPSRLHVKDEIDLWYKTSVNKRFAFHKMVLMYLIRMLKLVTGVALVPYLSLAIKKSLTIDKNE